MAIVRDIPQRWWEIVCTFDGVPGFHAMSVGETQQEAEANFKDSIDSPELAVITAIRPIGLCTAAQALGTKAARRKRCPRTQRNSKGGE